MKKIGNALKIFSRATGLMVMMMCCAHFLQAADHEKHALLKQANEFFHVDEFDEARELFLKYDSQWPGSNEVKYKLGICYLKLKQHSYALAYLKQVNYTEYIASEKALDHYLGAAYHENGKYDSATVYYERYLKTLQAHHPKSYPKLTHEILERIEACKNGKEFEDHVLKVFITNLGNNVNTAFDDYSPVISADQKVMYFTSKRARTSGNELEGMLDEIYMSSQNDQGQWAKATKVPELNSNEFHDAPVALSHDGHEMILYRSISRKNGDLYHTVLQNGKWSAPTKLPGHIDTKYWEPSACFANDGKTLYFASDRPGGFGGSDLYVSQKDATGNWSEPVNLGNTINTDHDEDSPFMLADNKTLYFSSKAHKNIGGYDVFKSVYTTSNSSWSEPQNMGFPINTPDDDIYFVWSDDGSKAFFASNRTEDNYGLKDIYTMDLKLIPYDVRVLDANGQVLHHAYIELTNTTSNKKLGTFSENAYQDRITFYMAPKVKYRLKIKALGYDSITDEAAILDRADFYQYYTKDYQLHPTNTASMVSETAESANGVVKANQDKPNPDKTLKQAPPKAKNTTPNKEIVYFDYNTSELTDTQKDMLNAWVATHGKERRIIVHGHTDNVGNQQYNMLLSKYRAAAVSSYLHQLGVPKAIILVKSSGESIPIVSNESEEGRTKNRRVEIITR